MEDYRKLLRTVLFSEKTIISYRLLSRKLKVHVNQAKEMLYDFHTAENTRKPNCVHATYVVTGLRKLLPAKDEEGSDGEGKDTEMQCSPFDSSLPATEEKVELMRVVELCQEEELEATKAEFEKVLSVHVYSLEPVSLRDLSTLTGCSADVQEIAEKVDPLKMGATYGTILNSSAKRTGSRAPPPAPEPKKSTLAVQVKKDAVPEKKETKSAPKDTKIEVKTEEKEKKSTVKTSTVSAKKAVPPAAAKPKKGQSNLFASWGNAPKKSTDSVSESNSAAQSPKAEDEPDVKMDSDNDEEEDEEDTSQPIHNNAEDVKKRKERDEELRKMMDDDEEDEDTKMEEDEPPIKIAKTEASPEAEEPSRSTTEVTSTSGRRRGKRKVMKKIQSRDEEGYLVTKTEAVWESFSEDEPESPPKPKSKAAATKGKKGAIAGQGNIMSFFGKK